MVQTSVEPEEVAASRPDDNCKKEAMLKGASPILTVGKDENENDIVCEALSIVTTSGDETRVAKFSDSAFVVSTRHVPALLESNAPFTTRQPTAEPSEAEKDKPPDPSPPEAVRDNGTPKVVLVVPRDTADCGAFPIMKTKYASGNSMTVELPAWDILMEHSPADRTVNTLAVIEHAALVVEVSTVNP
jgi:hypothetical protein